MPLLAVRDLSLGYEAKPIVDKLSFELNEGNYLCIIGENGSGKTTLMRTLLNLQQPLSGTVFVSEEFKNGIGYLPQQTAIQKDFPASVAEVVISGCLRSMGIRPFYNREERARARKNMERTGVFELRDRCYRELSGGQQQRVLLARALCAAEKALLLDEPVSGLDPDARGRMYDLIDGLNRDGIAIIMITHDLPEAERYASHILHLGRNPVFAAKQHYFAGTAADPSAGKGGDAA